MMREQRVRDKIVVCESGKFEDQHANPASNARIFPGDQCWRGMEPGEGELNPSKSINPPHPTSSKVTSSLAFDIDIM